MVAQDGSDARTRPVGITPAGFDVLKAAMPVVVGIQQRLFGAGGAPGGMLLEGLRELATIDDG